jgi:adenylylsulfate kinase-like enzyme
MDVEDPGRVVPDGIATREALVLPGAVRVDHPGGGVVWITGLPRVGKSTIAGCVARALRDVGSVVTLDGDRLRELLPGDVGYSRDERRALAGFYARLACHLAAQEHHVVVATVSLFHEVHAWNRAHAPNYLEVLVRAERAASLQWDDRGIYHAATDVMGRDIEPEFPLAPDLTVTNGPGVDPQVLADLVVAGYAPSLGRRAEEVGV